MIKNFIEFFQKNNLTAPALIMAVSLIFMSITANNIAETFINKDNIVSVSGTAEREVKSDTAKLTINFSTGNIPDRTQGQTIITSYFTKIKRYLEKAGVAPNSIAWSGVASSDVCALNKDGYENCSLGVVGYRLRQVIAVETDKVDLVQQIKTDINGMFPEITMSSDAQYYYNELKNIRAEMLNEATKNALERAKSIASAGGAKINRITSLSSGVFQVTAINSVDFESYGSYDTSVIYKKITAIVKANFSLK